MELLSSYFVDWGDVPGIVHAKTGLQVMMIGSVDPKAKSAGTIAAGAEAVPASPLMEMSIEAMVRQAGDIVEKKTSSSPPAAGGLTTPLSLSATGKEKEERGEEGQAEHVADVVVVYDCSVKIMMEKMSLKSRKNQQMLEMITMV